MSAHPSDHRLVQWALDELAADEHAALERHLEGCAACRVRADAERALDELVVASALSPAPGESERVLARFWQALDATVPEQQSLDEDRGPDAAGPRPDAPVGLRLLPWMAAAAALLLAIWAWAPSADAPSDLGRSAFVDGSDRSAGDEGVRDAADADSRSEPGAVAAGVAPDASDGSAASIEAGQDEPLQSVPFDAERLASARLRVGEVLSAADELYPFRDESFAGACDEGLLALRREGWPVTNLLRGLALGDDDLLAEAALRLALLESSSRRIVVAALERPGRAATALTLLRERQVDVDDSPATLAALERLALDDDPALRLDALAVLAAQDGPGSARSLGRLVDESTRSLPSGRRRAEALDALVSLLEDAPARFAVPAALALRERAPDAAERVDPLLRRRCVTDRAASVEALRAALEADRPPSGVTDLVADAGLDELVPALLRGAGRRASAPDAACLRALVALGGRRAAAGLFQLWLEQGDHAARGALGDALAELVLRDPLVLRELGAAAGDGDLDDLIAFAEGLPAGARTVPLWAALVTRPDGDRPGRPETLLAALARLGDGDDGRALLAWLAVRPGDEHLAPLAWAAAGSLAPRDAERAFAAAGRDPRALRDAARTAQARFRVDELPSHSQLSDLRRALQRVRGPPR